MEGKRFIKRIKVQNLLSFDEEGIDLELQPLNVLIGANGSGKSNLIDVVSVLGATAVDLSTVFSSTGGFTEWFNKRKRPGFRTAFLEVALSEENSVPELLHMLSLQLIGAKMEVFSEVIAKIPIEATSEAFYGYADHTGHIARLNYKHNPPIKEQSRMLDVHPSRSILSQRSDPDYYPELYSLAKRYSQIHLYRGWSMGRIDAPRLPQPADALGIYLNENAANLGAVLNELKIHTALFDKFLNGVKEIAPRITRVEPVTRGGTVQVHIGEEGLEQLVPATRLADGTIRFMCLLTILMSTPPPSLVCIEEPELGLHPDMIRKVAELLVEASQRMQLIVTTHSDLLVSYLSEHVESIVVCEHDGKGTRMERLEREKIKGWLENYSLGEMWTRGHIGGNRW